MASKSDRARDQAPANGVHERATDARIVRESDRDEVRRGSAAGAPKLIVPDTARVETHAADAAEESGTMPAASAETKSATQAASEAAEAVQDEIAAQAVETAETTWKAGLAAYDALVDAYVATAKFGLQAQERGLALTRRAMDEALTAQGGARELAEQWATSSRKLQQAWLDTTETSLRTIWGGWYRDARED